MRCLRGIMKGHPDRVNTRDHVLQLVHLELFDIWCVLKSATLGYSNYKIRILQRGDGVAWPEGRVGVICWLDVGPRIREQFGSAIKNRWWKISMEQIFLNLVQGTVLPWRLVWHSEVWRISTVSRFGNTLSTTRSWGYIERSWRKYVQQARKTWCYASSKQCASDRVSQWCRY